MDSESPIVDRLIGAGVLTRAQAHDAAEEATRTRRPIERVLVEAGYCAESDLTNAEALTNGSSPLGSLPAVIPTSALLFTAIVDSTQWADELGMTQWRELLAHHNTAVNQVIERHRGLDTTAWGDAFFCRFDDVAAAVECAKSAVRSVEPLGIRIRAGLHVAEIQVGTRVVAAAQASEVLVTQAVCDALPELEVLDRGTHHLKGLDVPLQLYSLA